MKRTLYIFQHGTLKREGHTLVLLQEDDKRVLPVETIGDIHVFGEITFNKKLLEFLTRHQIPVHVYNYFGYYVGTYYPRTALNSGLILVHQVAHYLDSEKRMELARAFVDGALRNMQYVLRRYQRGDRDMEAYVDTIEGFRLGLPAAQSPAECMALEGQSREVYYAAFSEIIQTPDFVFERRTRRPPGNRLNALISFGNMVLYRVALSEIYRTHLDPRIGYLHESNQRAFSLNLDLAEIFKPLIVDRTIFALINRGQMRPQYFEEKLGGVFLKEAGQKVFVQALEESLRRTITHKRLRRKVSYRRLIRLECYKLYRHILGETTYQPFVLTR